MPVMYIPGHSVLGRPSTLTSVIFLNKMIHFNYTKGWFLEDILFFVYSIWYILFILSNQNKMFNFIYENKLSMFKTFKLQTVHMVSSMEARTGKVQ